MTIDDIEITGLAWIFRSDQHFSLPETPFLSLSRFVWVRFDVLFVVARIEDETGLWIKRRRVATNEGTGILFAVIF